MRTHFRDLYSTRISRLTLTVLCVAMTGVMLIGLAGCGSTDTTTESDNSVGQTTDALMTGTDILSAIEDVYGSEPWFAHIESIEVEQMLLTQVAIVHTDLIAEPGEPYEFATQIGNAVTEVAADSVPNARVLAAGGLQMSGASIGALAEDTLELPAAPSDADALSAWLQDVFGDSEEIWVDHVVSIEVSTDYPGWLNTTVIVVHTDIEGGRTPENQDTARLIGMAIDMSGQTMAENYAVNDAEDAHILSGDIPTASLAY